MKKLGSQILNTFYEARQIYREKGFKAVFKRYGWKLVIGIFTYYLVRDITLYILIPYFLWKSF
jgi:hypothetical protein